MVPVRSICRIAVPIGFPTWVAAWVAGWMDLPGDPDSGTDRGSLVAPLLHGREVTDLTEQEQSVQPSPPRSKGNSRTVTAISVLAVVLLLAVVVASTYHLSYYRVSPGSVNPLDNQITVSGTPEFIPDGEVYFTTVSLLGEVTVLEAVGAWMDPAVDLVSTDEILGGRSPDENRQVNLQAMSDSQEVAKRVALEQLGFDVIQSNGVIVAELEDGTPAAEVLDVGDTVAAVDGEQIETWQQMVDLIHSHQPGDVIELTLRRRSLNADGQPVPPSPDAPTEDVKATLADRDGVAFLGMAGFEDLTPLPLPFDIEIDTANVGGPSAGLALTLAVLDVLTPGELTGGLQVATTGTIDPTGRVGNIGGIEQKAHAVRRAGVDLFIVPTDHVEAARKVLGDEVEVAGVDNLQDALDVLAAHGGNAHELAMPEASKPAA